MVIIQRLKEKKGKNQKKHKTWIEQEEMLTGEWKLKLVKKIKNKKKNKKAEMSREKRKGAEAEMGRNKQNEQWKVLNSAKSFNDMKRAPFSMRNMAEKAKHVKK